MNIHEYQAKKLLKEYGISSPQGWVISSQKDLEALALEDKQWVVKAQIHAGGRGKGFFKESKGSGVRVVFGAKEVREAALAMLGNTLVTEQTGPMGKKVSLLYICEAVDIQKEYYIAITLDRNRGKPVIILSDQGGMNIEDMAQKNSNAIISIVVDPFLGIGDYQVRKITSKWSFTKELREQMVTILQGLWRLYIEKDCTLVEINPLICTKYGKWLALDAKISLDDNALFRNLDLQNLHDPSQEDPKEILAATHKLNYIALDGTIACIVNGAGLAMATMDIIQYYGGKPANFLDVGGGANQSQVRAAFEIIISDPNVRGIFVNIFGGIMHCDIIAKAIIDALGSIDLKIPLVVRLEGTKAQEARELLSNSKIQLTTVSTLAEGAKAIVKATCIL